MPVDYSNHPILDIRTYLLSELFASGVLTLTDYPTTQPLVPIQQLPETNNEMTKPFVVYDFLPMHVGGTNYWINRDAVTFVAFATDYLKVLEIQSLILDVFRRMDKTAEDINAFVTSNNKFLFFQIMGSVPPNPIHEEGGRYGGSVIIEYEYTRAISNTGRYAV